MTTPQIAMTVFAFTRNLQTSKQTPYSSEVQHRDLLPQPCAAMDRRISLGKQEQSWDAPVVCIQVAKPEP